MSHPRRVDAVLVSSFGGPEGHDDVIDFLENVTRGRGIPRERLAEVGEHYYHFEGKSPLNELNREIIANLKQECARNGLDLPIYFGNRNWHPFNTDTIEEIYAAGHREILVIPTSAWAGYSGCRQYHEDLQLMLDTLVAAHGPDHGVTLTKTRQFFDHPLLIAELADAVTAALAGRDADTDGLRVVFTAHSIPNSADEASGPAEWGGGLYSRQVREAAALVAAACGVSDFDVVWQSRSGPPQVPWLEPDIVDHATDLAEQGYNQLVVCPIGFISDHIEVLWDLDEELAKACAELGVQLDRVATPGPSQRFAEMLCELLLEHINGTTPRGLSSQPAQLGCALNGQPCAEVCCPPPPRRRHSRG